VFSKFTPAKLAKVGNAFFQSNILCTATLFRMLTGKK